MRKTILGLPPTQDNLAGATNATRFAMRLNDAMSKKAWTQADLVREANNLLPKSAPISRQLVSNYCRGKNLPHQHTLHAIAKALKLDPAILLPEGEASWIGGERMVIRTVGDEPNLVHLHINARVDQKTALQVMGLINRVVTPGSTPH